MSDLEAIKSKWLNQCGPCDFGMPEYVCSHPAEDYRPVMMDLVLEIERLRRQSDMPVFVIKAKDALAIHAVGAYRELCRTHGLNDQAAEVQKALDEIFSWQVTHDDQVKLPDHKHVPVSDV